MIEYKVVELSTVTDDDIERAINTWVTRGVDLRRYDIRHEGLLKAPFHGFYTSLQRNADELGG